MVLMLTMQIDLNGNSLQLEQPLSLSDFIGLHSKTNAPKMVVLNDTFIPPGNYENELINEGDKIKIILFMGGG